MKVTILSNDILFKKVQRFIDEEIRPTNIALAYNDDTSRLNLDSYRLIEIMDAGNIISSKRKFDINVSNYEDETIDLAVIGIGYKGQIGFNEVGTPYNSTKHFQKLTISTREEYSAFGELPDEGETLGIYDICSAKNIIVIATGEKRAEAVFNMIYGRDDSTVPAAFLQIPLNVYVFADNLAAKKL